MFLLSLSSICHRGVAARILFRVNIAKPTARTLPRHFAPCLRLQNPQQIVVFMSQKIVLVFTNHEHRAGRRPRDSGGSAANGEVFPAGETMRGDHDQVDIEFFRCFDNLMRGCSLAYFRSCSGHAGSAGHMD